MRVATRNFRPLGWEFYFYEEVSGDVGFEGVATRSGAGAQETGTSGEDISGLDSVIRLDERRRELLRETEQLKNRRNVVSKEVAQKKKAGEEAADTIAEMRRVGDRIKELDEEVRQVERELDHVLLTLPNLPHESVPVGESEEDNQPVRHWGKFPGGALSPSPIGSWRRNWISLILSVQPR